MLAENKRLHTAIIGGSSAHKKFSMQEFQKLDLSTGQPKVLTILSEKEGYLQKDLALRCHVEPATMTSIINNMEAKGLVFRKRESVSGGKRAYAIFLTEKGKDLACKVNQIINDVEKISFIGFREDEKQLLIELLNRVQTNLEKYESREN